MKRWFAATLALILALTQMSMGVTIAWAEDTLPEGIETPPEEIEMMLGDAADDAEEEEIIEVIDETAEDVAPQDDVDWEYFEYEDVEGAEALNAIGGFVLAEDDVTLALGSSFTLVPLTPEGSAISADLVMFVSENPALVSVDSNGLVTALDTGAAYVAVTYDGQTQYCTVTVPGEPTAIKLSTSSVAIGLGETYDGLYVAATQPSGAMAQVTWSSSKESIVAVDPLTGAVTGVKTGSATITAITRNGKKAKCTVKVRKAPTGMTLKPAALKVLWGSEAQRLTLKLSGNVASAKITYTSSDPLVATVDETGLVTPIGVGSAIIKATAYNGAYAQAAVTVLDVPGIVKLSDTDVTISVGSKTFLSASATAKDGQETLATLRYYVDGSSPNPGSVKVDAKTGKITAVTPGTAYVNAITQNNVFAADPCVVTVMPKLKSLSIPSKYTMSAEQTLPALEGLLVYADGSTQPATGLTWTSSNKKVLTVDAETGELTGIKKGTATLKAKSPTGKSASCKVTVTQAPTGIDFAVETLKLSAGGSTFKLGVTVANGSAEGVTFTSSDTAVATVADNGRITTVNPGTATITGETYNGLTATCAVTVTDLPASLSFSETRHTLSTTESYVPDVTIKAADGSEAVSDLSFRILSGAQCIDLDTSTGEITGKAAGTAEVSVVTHNGISASNTCVVTVVASPTAVALDASRLILGVGEVDSLKASVTVASGGNDSVTWSSSKEGVATVDANGTVTGVARGSAVITATTVNGLTASCKVTVYPAPTSISLSPTSGSIQLGSVAQYTITLSSGSGGEVTFKSSDSSIVSVDDEGIVTGLQLGTVYITATTYNGLTATAKLTVKSATTVTTTTDDEDEDEDYDVDERINTVIAYAKSQLGMPYIYGAGYKTTNPSGFDCSGLTYWCYYKIGIKLKDSSGKQGSDDTYAKVSMSELRPGDVVCFKDDSVSYTNHVGIYLGNSQFIHASSSAGKVIISDITTNYWTRNLLWGRRIID